MSKVVFVYEPTEEELKAIEDSWLEDFQQNKQSLTKWFQKKFSEFVNEETANCKLDQ